MNELRVRVLGAFEVEGVPARVLGGRKARTLLKLVALARGQPVSIDRIVDALWGDNLPAQPTEQVQVLVSRLRAVLGADRLVRRDPGYALRLDWLDLIACEQFVEEAERRLQAGQPAPARAAAAAALELARGPLLADEPDAVWAEAGRVAADRLAARARLVVAHAALAAGDLTAATAAAVAALDHDPYDEVALRALMAAQARAGRPGSALAAYARVRARLAEDLGVSPTPETEALHTEILLAADTASPAPSPVAAPAGLFGRDAELAALDAALGRVAGGRHELVLVTGEAGIGRTLLVTSWADGARMRATVLTGRCDELARGLPLQGVVDALDDHLRGLDDTELGALFGPDHDVLAPLFGRVPARQSSLLALAAPVRNPYAADPLILVRALVDLVARIAARAGPLVLVLDDVHLAGEATIALVRFAHRRLSGSPVLVVVTQRAEEAVDLPADVDVRVGPLDLEATAAMVGRDRAAELHARSGGHPLFLAELAQVPAGEELPASVREAVAARCERAGPAVSTTLRTAAVLGEGVDLELLAETLGADAATLLDHLEEGVRRLILEERGSAFTFRHTLVRTALESGTSAARRALLHQRAARALARRPRADPLAVAHHARLGGEVDLAAAALVDAAAAAASRYDLTEAERLLGESIELCDTTDARVARARVRVSAGRLDDADDDVAAALVPGRAPAALEAAAWVAHYRRDFESAVRLADEGARLAVDPGERAACLMAGGYASHCHGDLAAAESRFREASSSGAHYEAVVASMWLGGLLIHRGEAERGIQAVRAARRAGIAPAHAADPHAHALFFESLGLGMLGRADEVLATLDTMQRATDRHERSRWSARVRNVRGWVLRNLGEHSAADDTNEEALALATAAGHAEPAVHAHLDLATGRLATGDPAGAAEHLAAARTWQRVPHSMLWRNQLRHELLTARLALAVGDVDGAVEGATSLCEHALALGATRYVVLADLVAAEASFRAGRHVDPVPVDRLLARLPEVAGLEAWWLTAGLAEASGVERWRRLAVQRAAELAAHAGPHRPTLERAADRLLGGRPHRR